MVRRGIGMALAAIVGSAALFAAPAAQATPTLLLDLQSGRILHAEDATRPWHPASLSKLMTAYVVFRKIQEGRLTLDTPVAISKRASQAVPSKMGYPVGTKVTINDALKMLIVPSANDIAIAIAEGTSGSVEAFADEMNRYGRDIGMQESYWVNPSGLPDKRQISTARDLAILSVRIMRDFPQYADLFQIQRIQSGKKVLRSHNSLLYRYPGTSGMKTGFICASGYNVVATNRRNGRHMLAVVMGSPSAIARTELTAQLFEENLNGSGGGIFATNSRLAQLARSPDQSPGDVSDVTCNRNKPDTSVEAVPVTGAAVAFAGASEPAAAPPGPLLLSWSMAPPVQVGPYTGPRPAVNTIPEADLVAAKPAVKVPSRKPRAAAAAKRAKPVAKPAAKPARKKRGS